MNAPSLLLRRTVAAAPTTSTSICTACRRALFAAQRRTFHSTPAAAVATFQSYPLHRPPPQPRNAVVPETSIAQPIETPMPRVHETRPPKQPRVGGAAHAPRVSEAEAQSSRQEFAEREPSTGTQTTPPPLSANPADTTAPAASAGAAAAAPVKPAAKPRSKLRAPGKAAMKLTPAAVEQLQALLDGPEPQLIRVGVRNKGCSGLAYHLEYVDKPSAFDEQVEQDGVRVVIDSKALFSIIGSEMDWVEDKISQRFVFRNPNIKEECGCGESFMV